MSQSYDDELKAILEKYKIPKPIQFAPNHIEISIKRTSKDNFLMAYKEFFDYLPEAICGQIIAGTMNALIQTGIPQENIQKISPTGIETKIENSAEVILSIILSEFLGQKNFTEQEVKNLLEACNRIIANTTNARNLAFEWNDEIQKQIKGNNDELTAIIKNNPSFLAEMQALTEKYSSQFEDARNKLKITSKEKAEKEKRETDQ